MMTRLFSLAVLVAAIYLGVSQYPAAGLWLQQQWQHLSGLTRPVGVEASRIQVLESKVEQLQAQLLAQQQALALGLQQHEQAVAEPSRVKVQVHPAEPWSESNLSAAERQRQVGELAERMQLKALSYPPSP